MALELGALIEDVNNEAVKERAEKVEICKSGQLGGQVVILVWRAAARSQAAYSCPWMSRGLEDSLWRLLAILRESEELVFRLI
ncbi:unnamed protein product [Clonostachys rosea]|uniref:Uncharacterized protein n=1 Tax=Bionectria ochroleuca TaxID=29856 RepID=A0ABY6TSJ2_BIOOC|nr:unnamed protein product [Clonostachys rosea]